MTLRELQVAKLVTEGHRNKHIAYVLGLSERTVNAHVMKGLKRMGARNRTHFAVIVDRALRA